MTGLHLHGLNVNGREFNTQAQPMVDAFAVEWGFIKTDSITIESIREVREFCEEASETGRWNGVAVEGFVVRTNIGPRPAEQGHDTPPYTPGSSFFFKVKFDEPYMMYRDWREITKALLSAKQKGSITSARISKAKLKRPETLEYKNWVEKEILRNPKAFADYQNNRGIIAVREAFLRWRETPEGQRAAEATRPVTPPPQHRPTSTKTVLVPVAVPGCGMSTCLCVASSTSLTLYYRQNDRCSCAKTSLRLRAYAKRQCPCKAYRQYIP
jgi:tRNA ligase